MLGAERLKAAGLADTKLVPAGNVSVTEYRPESRSPWFWTVIV